MGSRSFFCLVAAHPEPRPESEANVDEQPRSGLDRTLYVEASDYRQNGVWGFLFGYLFMVELITLSFMKCNYLWHVLARRASLCMDKGSKTIYK